MADLRTDAPPTAPRVAPARRDELGFVNALLMGVIRRGAGTVNPPNLFATLGRHRGLFRRWLLFAGALMPGGRLPRRETELVILRVAHLSRCPYEADHHVRMGKKVGLTDEDIARTTRDDLDAGGWSGRERAILGAVDDLHRTRTISEATFAALRPELTDVELVELCLLTGHYEMLAGTINGLGIQVDRHR